jgi:AraC-like DNA-binding protein
MPEGTGLQSLMCFFLAGVFPVQEGVLRLLPVVLPGGHPATSLLLRVAGSLCHDTEEQSSSLPPHFLGGFLSMLAGTLESQRQAPTGLQRLPPVHLPRIKAHLREHLRQPGLTVDSVARALGLSVSQVHRVFAHEGCTVSEWLWRERLEGCAGELAHASEARRTVGEIALSWGFNDLSHFSYAFKKRYGMSPKEWRDQAR